LGGGSSMINTVANTYCVNDIDSHIIDLHRWLFSYANNRNEFFKNAFVTIDNYGLSCSYKENCVPEGLRKSYPKTYFAKYNKQAYLKMKNDFNNNHDEMLLFLLLIYGFNHMIRFNSKGNFNLPVGNVDFNSNVVKAVNDYFDFCTDANICFINNDYQTFIQNCYNNFSGSDFIYFDPPYLISQSEYNSLWGEKEEHRLYSLLDYLDSIGVKWGLSNLFQHKGIENRILIDWALRYNVYKIQSNYISFNDNSKKMDSLEVFVTNYDK
jgi:site-specific DNA-adenine methylase